MVEPILSFRDSVLYRNGIPHRILAGAIHYFRVHPQLWRDRLEKLHAMGANTVDTYVAWNFHQLWPEDAPDFTQWRDLGAFIDLAAEVGLDVIVRPGPYICAEWDNGGFPSWLTGTAGITLRSTDPLFTAPVERWLDQLMPIIAARQAAHGGPVVAVQVENEYGSYAQSAEYIHWNARALRARGITEILFTADGGSDFYLDGGSVPEIWATATLGSGGGAAMDTWARRRPGEPFFNVEFWGGWFDHWGEDHHVRDAEDAAAEIRGMLERGGSLCVYMAHGGTNFGLWAGANAENGLQPTVSSYDSDAPISESGELTPKFHAIRREFLRAAALPEEQRPVLPAQMSQKNAVLPAQTLSLKPAERSLLEFLRTRLDGSEKSQRPLSFEELRTHHGLVFYRSQVTLPGTSERGAEARIQLPGLHDRAHLWIDGELIGILDDTTGAAGMTVTGHGSEVVLELLVENLGRINYGPLTGQGKGLLGGVLINGRYSLGWEQVPLDLQGLDLESVASAGGSVLASATVELDAPADTFLAFPGAAKGFVWVNGFLLGRFWNIGPQQTLYLPAPLLRRGENTFHVLNLEEAGSTLELRESPELGAVDKGSNKAAELL